ncbi:MAG: Yip1 family protein [Chitinophagaceae bacterium]
MEDLLETNPKDVPLSDIDIFTKIWTSPRPVFKFINDNQYDKFVIFLLVLMGISKAFEKASSKHMGDTMSFWAVIAFCIIGGALFGWISYAIYAALLSWTGRWLKAEGNTRSILRIIAYASIPAAVGVVLFILPIVIYGNEIFKSEGDLESADMLSNIFVYSSIFLQVALAIWTIFLCVIGISEVQKLSIGKSILNLLLPFFVIFIPIFAIFLVIGISSHK